MAASEQEALVTALAGQSFGAPYVFHPEVFRKGNALREPADLAWQCRDVLLLFTMQAGTQGYESQSNHNIRQLAGFIRLWQSGRALLLGSNQHQQFELDFKLFQSFALISVVQGSESLAEIHWAAMDDLRAKGSDVAIVATVPFSVVEALGRRAGTAHDLAGFLIQLNLAGGRVSEDDALKMLAKQYERAVRRAFSQVRPDRDTELDTETQRKLVQGQRQLPTDGMTNIRALRLQGGVAAFNDLTWESTAKLVLSSADMIRLVRDVPPGFVGPTVVACLLELEQYVLIVGAADAGQMLELNEDMLAYIQQQRLWDRANPALMIQYHLVGRPRIEYLSTVMVLPDQTEPSTTLASLRIAGRRIGSSFS